MCLTSSYILIQFPLLKNLIDAVLRDKSRLQDISEALQGIK